MRGSCETSSKRVAQLLDALAFLDPGGHRLAQREGNVQGARLAVLFPGQHGGLVDRADTATGGLATPFGGDRQRPFEERPNGPQPREHAPAGGARLGGTACGKYLYLPTSGEEFAHAERRILSFGGRQIRVVRTFWDARPPVSEENCERF